MAAPPQQAAENTFADPIHLLLDDVLISIAHGPLFSIFYHNGNH
jgi:hypothetical protein